MYKERVRRLEKKVAEARVDAYFVDDPVNLFYLTGVSLSAGRFVITPEGSRLYVDGRYTQLCEHIPAYPIGELPEFKRIGFNKEKTSYAAFEKLKGEKVPLEDLVAQLRMIKDEGELALLRESARLGFEGYEYVRSLLKEGVSEQELSLELDIFWKRAGAGGVAFEPIIAFGANSSMPHYHPRDVRLKKDDAVLIDIGVTLHHYHSDMTRVEFFGKVNPEMKRLFSIVQEAKQAALAISKPGTTVGELDDAARGVIGSAGFGEQFTHSLGHGIGLEVHEAPFLRNREMILQQGMVITIEPGIYVPGLGGVRLEDTIAITDAAYENLTSKT